MSHRERDDSYHDVVAQLSSRLRVITCEDKIQWILQKRDGFRSGKPRWTGISFCTTKRALLRESRRHLRRFGDDPQLADGKLGFLPSTFEEHRDDSSFV
ncbi:hypothetical protein SAMN05444004_12529 [Jannaschia faecimaris]|uniref:Uncharacterized protein n=1 Tax=Jannaschia faecimaris TaxID=1244108 RepID=A0A1H3U7Q4_9RHOB|nr:hypothetical protein SAMN05444004_12529 [Jannaschia faecimaris]